jgi:hypothetical protein
MPHGIEYIVRPFQSPGSLGNIIIPASPKETTEQAHIVWGGKGTMPSVKLLNPATVVNLKKEVLDERDRETDPVTIHQEGKPENYVVVDRARTVRLDKDETDSGGTLNYNYYASQDPKLDSKMDPYLENFRRPAQNAKSSGPSKVTWNLKND